MKNPPPRFICCKCRKQQPFSSNSRLRCMVLRENGKFISFSKFKLFGPAHALAASEYNWYSIRISRSIQGVKINNINIEEEQPHKSHKKHTFYKNYIVIYTITLSCIFRSLFEVFVRILLLLLLLRA